MRKIYTDGSCKGNPGPGGFAVVVYDDGKLTHAYTHKEPYTTNNKMEMKAILYAIEHFAFEKSDIDFFAPIIYSDSQYAIKCFTEWINGWRNNGWRKANGQEIENLDLIMKFDELKRNHKFFLEYVKGHKGNAGNELANDLAQGKITVDSVVEGEAK